MFTLDDAKKKLIEDRIEKLFDDLAFHFLGSYATGKGKQITFTTVNPYLSLYHLYKTVTGQDRLNGPEEKGLTGLIRNASAYIESLKHNTKADIIHSIDSLFNEASVKKVDPDFSQIGKILQEKMAKAKTGMSTIVVSEATKVKNFGAALDIAKVGASLGEPDPTVCFITMKDQWVCKFCIQNHLMPDRVTPRLYKMSEVKFSYLSQEDRKNGLVSACGQHPSCRCSISITPRGFGYKNGILAYIGHGFDALADQRKTT